MKIPLDPDIGREVQEGRLSTEAGMMVQLLRNTQVLLGDKKKDAGFDGIEVITPSQNTSSGSLEL